MIKYDSIIFFIYFQMKVDNKTAAEKVPSNLIAEYILDIWIQQGRLFKQISLKLMIKETIKNEDVQEIKRRNEKKCSSKYYICSTCRHNGIVWSGNCIKTIKIILFCKYYQQSYRISKLCIFFHDHSRWI